MDKHPKRSSPVGRASLNPGPHSTTIYRKPNCFQLGFFLAESPALARCPAICLLSATPSPVNFMGHISPKSPSFFSLLSVCLLTVQEGEPRVYAGFRAGGLKLQLVSWSDREQRKRLLAYDGFVLLIV